MTSKRSHEIAAPIRAQADRVNVANRDGVILNIEASFFTRPSSMFRKVRIFQIATMFYQDQRAASTLHLLWRVLLV